MRSEKEMYLARKSAHIEALAAKASRELTQRCVENVMAKAKKYYEDSGGGDITAYQIAASAIGCAAVEQMSEIITETITDYERRRANLFDMCELGILA